MIFLEYRDLRGVRMTFFQGKQEPIWLVGVLAKKLGHISRVARRLRWNHKLVRAAVYHAEWNPIPMRREQEAALAAGFRCDLLMDSPHALVFPAAALRNRPIKPVRRRKEVQGSRRSIEPFVWEG